MLSVAAEMRFRHHARWAIYKALQQHVRPLVSATIQQSQRRRASISIERGVEATVYDKALRLPEGEARAALACVTLRCPSCAATPTIPESASAAQRRAAAV